MSLLEVGIFGTILLVGLLAGNELCALIIHLALDRLPTAQSLVGSQAITRRLGQLMPVFMSLTIVVTLATGIALSNASSALLIAAGCALIGMLVITIVGLRPLNDHELAATTQTPENDWRSWRRKWVRLHTMRVGCDVAALVMVAVAAAIK